MTSTSTTNFSITMKVPKVSPALWHLMTGQKRGRGWKARTQLRCASCSRFAKVTKLDSGMQGVDCKRCGKEQAYVGRRFF